jgi:hypothetical protein
VLRLRASAIAGVFCLVELTGIRQKRPVGRFCRVEPAKFSPQRHFLPGPATPSCYGKKTAVGIRHELPQSGKDGLSRKPAVPTGTDKHHIISVA